MRRTGFLGARMDKLWLKSYPEGVPPEIELDPNYSLVHMLEAACRQYGKRPAFTNFGHTSASYEILMEC